MGDELIVQLMLNNLGVDALPVLIIFPDFNEIFIRNRIFSHAHRHAGSLWPVRGPQVLLTALHARTH